MGLVDKCKILLKNKSLRYKVKFYKKLITTYYIKLDVAEELLEYILFEDIKENEYISNEQMFKLYRLASKRQVEFYDNKYKSYAKTCEILDKQIQELQ